MGIEINGKEYGFNSDIRLGVLELLERQDQLKMKHVKLVIKEILVPNPTPKELFNIRKSQLFKIMEKYKEHMERESSEIKKKRST